MKPRPLHFDNFDQLLADVLHLHSAGYARAGQWELPTMLDHISRIMTAAFDGSVRRFPAPVRWLARMFIRRMVKKQKYPSIPLKAPKAARPNPHIPIDQALTEFRSAVQRILALPGPFLDTPVFGRLTLHEFQQLQLLHAAHHLAFLIPNP